MKQTKILFLSLAAGLLFAACTQETLPVQGPEPGVQMEFSASLADATGTKTAVQADGITVHWTTDEAINVFYGSAMAGRFVSTNTEPAATTTFRGSLSSVSGASGSGTDYWALYPYDAEAVCDGSSVTMTVPAAQEAVAGTFADKFFPTLAKSTSRSLQFYNICGGARFSVTEEGVTSVIIRSIGGETLAGRVKVGMDSNDKPVVLDVLDGVSEVTVTAPEGGFEVGKNYFAALLPGVYERGLILTFVGGAGNTTRAYSHAIIINRSRFGQLDEVDNGIWDEMHRYFTITSQVDGNTISFTKLGGNVPTVGGTFSYSLDQGATWTSIGAWEDLASFSYTLNEGETLSLKGDLDKTCFGYRIFIPAEATVSGNIMSLVSGDGFADATELDTVYAFNQLFFQSVITDASKLVLPAITLTQWCYVGMFLSCTALTAAPAVLPASTLADYCYSQMFLYCGNLTSAPELPATTLATNCYFGMFNGCTSLTIAPELPATALASSCYATMFSGCSSLTSSPELPATTLANSCYTSMFWGCTSLTSAPELPATSLAGYCYDGMFMDCISLTSAPELPATILAKDCYNQMFYGCTNLVSAPELPATSLADNCYDSMFSGCTSLASTPDLPATTLADYCYSNMFKGCTSLASTPELPATTLDYYCYREMFSGCTSLTSAPELPATIMAYGCYSGMFSGCTSLTSAPELPATTLATFCYAAMFSDCTSLTSAPELPATALAYYCYESMFNGCTNLSYVKALFTTTPSDDYTKDWLAGVAATGTFVKSAEATWNVVGTNGVPEGWTIVVDGIVPVESVSLDKTSLSLMQETGAVLTATVSPDNATDPSVSWTSSNEGVVTVDQTGKLLARGIGSAAVTVTTTDGGKTATCAVTVTEAVPGQMYFTITSETAGNTISFTQLEDNNVPTVSGNFWYSLDGGATWTSIGTWGDLAGFSQTLDRNESLLLKGELDKTCFGYKIGIPTAATVSGNIMSLVSGDSFASVTELDAKYAFYSLFDGSLVTDASRLVLPATELTDFCYSNMFFGCSGLTSAPALPATSLAESCYFSMFQNCINLGSAPVLPATTMAQASYGMMFDGCKKLTTAPELSATVLADHCYFGMFWDCSNLTSAPELPVTELADGCYKFMFFKCSSLTSAPELPATTLAAGCYERMFWNCTNLSYVKALFTTPPSDDYTLGWLADVAETGTFVKSLDATWNVTGANGVPEGWTIETVEGTASGSSPEEIGYEEW